MIDPAGRCSKGADGIASPGPESLYSTAGGVMGAADIGTLKKMSFFADLSD
jgi:hypothetical protein